MPDEAEPVLESTVGTLLRRAAERWPSGDALVAYEADATRRSWTFAELLRDAERIASSMLERFETGKRVAVWAPNIPEWVVLELGLGLAALVLVTVNPAYRTTELVYVLGQ